VSRGAVRGVNGLEEFLVGGQWMSRCADTGNLGVWLWDLFRVTVRGNLQRILLDSPEGTSRAEGRWIESPGGGAI
jgi:hypothetical protein